jgi:hypothetical protein
MSQEEKKPIWDEPFIWDRKKVLALLFMFLVIGTLIVYVGSKEERRAIKPSDSNTAQFVISSWSYPDEYGQGIESIYAYENSSGDYVEYPDSPFSPSDNFVLQKNVTGFIFLQIICWFNRTLAGIPNSLPQGLNLIRHTATVTQSNGSVVFSQTNFTKSASSQAGDPLWWLRYDVVLAFVPIAGEIYTASITYEVFYKGTTGEYTSSPESITSFAEEVGSENDFSDTVGISASGGDSVTSDGDWITLTSDGDGATYEIVADPLLAHITTSEYPFFSLNCTSISEGNGWKLEQYDGSNWAYLQSDYVTIPGLYHYNMRSLDTQVEKFRITIDASATIKFDFFTAYTIEDYTLTQGNCEADDLLYCLDGVLYSQGVVGLNEYIRCNYDPALDVNGTIYSHFNIITNLDDEGFYFVWDNGDSNVETTVSGPLSGTITDFFIQADSKDGDVGNRSFSAILFQGIFPQWNNVSNLSVDIMVDYDLWALNMGLIFLGLFMIPASTIYLAKGGRHAMSTDKVFFALVIFILGCAFFIGGIFG